MILERAKHLSRVIPELTSLKERVRWIREDSLEHMEEYVKSFTEAVEARDGHVFLARDTRSALEYLESLEGESVKSKTSVGKEIGIRAFETDTGDFIASLLSLGPTHPILPLALVSFDEVRRAVSSYVGKELNTPEEVVRAVRQVVRERILQANVGITGANVLTSEGQIFLLENEGNIALVSHLPRVHVVVTGMEKVVKDGESAITVCKAQSLFETGRLPTYINVVSGPSSTSDLGEVVRPAQGPEELHVIILDNGRSELLRSPFRDVLKCINCGACVTFCPIFHAVGGTFGFTHVGPRGIILEHVNRSPEELLKKVFTCSLCGICSAVCPAGIDLRTLMRLLREKIVSLGYQTENNRRMVEIVERTGDTFGGERHGLEFYCC